jgi:peroxiredoxin
LSAPRVRGTSELHPNEVYSMALTPSTMRDLGTKMPAFELPATDGSIVRSKDLESAKGVLVMFICNHCPFVKHVRAGLAQFGRDYENSGLAVVAINSNDTTTHPDDSPEKMKAEVAEQGYVFPYLFDEDQSVARVFNAACTPDFFLFDRAGNLVYRGQFDGARPGNDVPVSGSDLRKAADQALSGQPVPPDQIPSVGCNIKWRAGNEPAYFSS